MGSSHEVLYDVLCLIMLAAQHVPQGYVLGLPLAKESCRSCELTVLLEDQALPSSHLGLRHRVYAKGMLVREEMPGHIFQRRYST